MVTPRAVSRNRPGQRECRRESTDGVHHRLGGRPLDDRDPLPVGGDHFVAPRHATRESQVMAFAELADGLEVVGGTELVRYDSDVPDRELGD